LTPGSGSGKSRRGGNRAVRGGVDSGVAAADQLARFGAAALGRVVAVCAILGITATPARRATNDLSGGADQSSTSGTPTGDGTNGAHDRTDLGAGTAFPGP